MTSLPLEILFGIYLGILTGIVPALIAGALGFVFKYFTGVTLPGLGVVVLALAIAGLNGGLLALNDPNVRASEHATAVITAIIVVLMLSLYAHSQGDRLGASIPRKMSLKALRNRTLSADVIERVGGRGQVKVTVAGEVGDVEGYPPLPADLRRELTAGEWTFPADLPLAELETRLADRLKSEYDLTDVVVTLDEKAKATINAAPPMGAISKRVPDGKRAISLDALVPTGLSKGESVRIVTPETTATGTLVAARSDEKTTTPEPGPGPDVAPDGGTEEAPPPTPTAPTTTGGEGRVTVAVDRASATDLLRADRGRVIVLSRGTRREYELTTLVRRAGKRFRKVSVKAGGPLDGHTIGEAAVRDAYDVVIVAARHDRWQVAPRGSMELSAGDELYVIGTRDALDRFAEVAA